VAVVDAPGCVLPFACAPAGNAAIANASEAIAAQIIVLFRFPSQII